MKRADKRSGFESYRTTAQAIGLIELLGNPYPDSKQVHIVEKIIRKLHLPWNACEDAEELIHILK